MGLTILIFGIATPVVFALVWLGSRSKEENTKSKDDIRKLLLLNKCEKNYGLEARSKLEEHFFEDEMNRRRIFYEKTSSRDQKIHRETIDPVLLSRVLSNQE